MKTLLLAVPFTVLVACGGAVEAPSTSTTASSSVAGDDGAPAPPGDTPPAPPPPPPSCDGAHRPPPPPPEPPGAGGMCGACATGHVCCSAPEPCAGYCVPDCRPAPEHCPPGTTCSGDGVCVR